MEAKHTPGPWIADGAQIFTDLRFVAQANGFLVDRETVAANARLIAAAPDLLEALQDVVALWDHHCCAHGDGVPSPLHVKVRAAIAKALA